MVAECGKWDNKWLGGYDFRNGRFSATKYFLAEVWSIGHFKYNKMTCYAAFAGRLVKISLGKQFCCSETGIDFDLRLKTEEVQIRNN